MRIMFVLFYLLCPIMTLAQEALPTPVPGEPTSLVDAVSFASTLISLVKQGNFLAAGSVLTLLLVWVFRRYGMAQLKIDAKFLPLIAAVVGLIAGISVSIMGGAAPMAAALATLSGPLAGTLWSALAKFFLPVEKPVEVEK